MPELPVALDGGLIYFTDEITAGAGRHRHTDSHPVHTHSFIEIFTVVEGACTHLSPLGEQRLTPGDVVLLRPGAWHALERCADLEIFNCCFAPEMLRRELAWTREDALLSYLLFEGPYTPGHQGTLALRLDEQALAEYVGHLEALSELRPPRTDRYRADVVGRLSLGLGVLARAAGEAKYGAHQPSGATSPTVLRAIRLLEAEMTRGWTLQELADACHVSPNYLSRLFKTTTGLPPMSYLAHHRAETAAVLLASTDDPISRVGAQVGWPDQSHFTRRFKAHYGVTPSTYRRHCTISA
ncbi:AraC family transcriptional regulator [Allokutzneria albata]|uniref:AraC family transcriptional regulator n=1 Tax=Allokutzneria albata TaxID=211114 RepID=UPI0004C390AE|nr:AraC family transcriptional regulator [Allokutzneria albata]